MKAVARSYAIARPVHTGLCARALFALACLVLSVTSAEAFGAVYYLGTTALLEGPTAGSNTVVLGTTINTATWTNIANASWLHFTPANTNGTGPTNVVFSYDANPGATRSGTLTIAGQTVTITQAGSTYVQAPGPLTTLIASGLSEPEGVAVDDLGNVYFADANNSAIKKWIAASNAVVTLVSSGLNYPEGVALDGAGNVYFSDSGHNAVKEWVAVSNTVITLVSSGLNSPFGVALDVDGNVYIGDAKNNAVKKWIFGNHNVVTVLSNGLNFPQGVAVDVAGNVYIADHGNSVIKEWVATSGNVDALVSLDTGPEGVAVDGSGNVYYAATSDPAIGMWTAVSGTTNDLIPPGSQLNLPSGVAVNAAGNVYLANWGSSTIDELPYAFVNPTSVSEAAGVGNDVLPAVLPTTEDLLPPFGPSSSESWLTIIGDSGGVVSFDFTGNNARSNRTATISLLGEAISVTQLPTPTPVITWTNTAGGNWSNPDNWSPNVTPGPADTAVIPGLVSNYTVTLDESATVSNIVVGATSGATTQTFNNGTQTLAINGLLQVNSQGAFILDGGTLEGTNVLEGTLTCSQGVLEGVMTVSNNGVLNFDGVGGKAGLYFDPVTLINNGTVNWTNMSLYDAAGSQIYNYGLWNAQSGNTFYGLVSDSESITLFDNFGTFVKSGATGTTTLNADVGFNNTGTVEVVSGTLTLDDPNFAGGTLDFVIGGPTSFGVINLEEYPTLTGTITANLVNNYIPMVSNSFQVINCDTAFSGAFADTNLPPVAVWRTTYNSTNVTLTVLKLVPQLTWANPANIVYGTVLGGAQLNATAASPNNLSGSLPGAFTYTPPVGTALQAGNNQTLSVTFKPTDQVNYTNVTTSVTINVFQAPLTITATNQVKNYGQTTTFAGTEFITDGLEFSDSVTSVTLMSAGAGPTAGVAGSPYTITNTAAIGNGLANYDITCVNGELTVNPAPLTVTASPQTTTYGQAAVFGSGSTLFYPSGLQNGETIAGVTLAIAGNGGTPTSPVSGSPYTITPIGATGGTFNPTNYSISYFPGTLMVGQTSLTVTADPQSKTYGQTVLFASGSTLFYPSGLQNGETIGSVTLTVSGNGGAATASVSGSPYIITPGAAAGGTFVAANYLIAYAPGALTVSQAMPAITWTDPAPIVYGAPLTSNQLDATANVPGSFAYNPPDDTVLDTGTNALQTSFTPSDTVDYTNVTDTVSLTVLPATLTVTADNQVRTYGQPNPALTGTITGVTNGDDITATYSTSATISSPVGTYSITPVLVDPSDRETNYTATLNNGTLTIVAFSSGVVFTLEPVGATNVAFGADVTFTAHGVSLQFPTATLQYQWRLNGVNIPGATNTDLTFLDVQPSNCGTITVTISDGIDAATSVPVGLSVAIPTIAFGNTNFASRFPLGQASSGVLSGNNINAIVEPNEPAIIAGNPGGKPVWFEWQPTNSGTAVITTQGSDFDTIMGVYTGTNVINLTRVPSCVNDDDSGGYLTSKVLFNCVDGTEYEIVVDGYWGIAGNLVLIWDIENFSEPLPTLFQVPPRQTISSNGSAVTLVCLPDSGSPAWLFDGALTTVTGPDFPISAVDYTNVGTYVSQTTDGGAVASTQPAHLQINLLEDGTSDTNSMAWNKFLDSVNAPYSNPPQSSIRKLGGGGDTRGFSVAQTFSTVGNELEPGEPRIDGQIGGSPAWYTYVTPTNGTLLVNTAGSSFNTLLGVFIGPGDSFATLTNIGAGYTTNRVLNGQPQLFVSNEPKGQTNFIVVDGYNGASGTVQLNINLGDPVVIGAPPQSQFVFAGSNASFTVAATGSTPLSYLWQFDGTNIAGATNASLTIFDVATNSAGVYSVVVSNLVSVVTNTATLSLGTSPVIGSQPVSQTIAAGSAANLSVIVTGAPPPAYQWMFNGNDIGTNGPALVIPDFEAGDQGTYFVFVSNALGTVASSNALLYLNTLQLSVASSNGSAIQLQMTGTAGGNYVIEASTDLVTWTPLFSNTAASGFLYLTDTNAGIFDQRFYRGVTN
jgi:sugar lactone lactonase YvrE